MLYDPQTSGGLLLSLPDAEAHQLLEMLRGSGIASAVKIGEVIGGATGIVVE